MDNASTAQYRYNALGWRVEKLVGGVYMEYLRGAKGQDLGENNRTSWTVSYPSAALRASVALGFGHYAIYQNNATYFTHPNSLGSTSQVTDYVGNLVQDRLFYPFGQDWALNGTLYDERFAKLQHRDTETALDPTPNRMYCSSQGRWLSPDPWLGDISDPQTLNRYPYAGNNPETRTDVSGLCPVYAMPANTDGGDEGALDYLVTQEVDGPGGDAQLYTFFNPEAGLLPLSGGGGGGLAECGGGGAGYVPQFSNGPWGGTFDCNKSASNVLSYLDNNFASLASTTVNLGPTSNIITFSDPAGITPGAAVTATLSVLLGTNVINPPAPFNGAELNVQSVSSTGFVLKSNPQASPLHGTLSFSVTPASSGQITFSVTANAAYTTIWSSLLGYVGKGVENGIWDNLVNGIKSYCQHK